MTDGSHFDDLADRLDAIEEELRDRAYDYLASAARDPESERGRDAASIEKRLNQARRSVAKAAGVLRSGTP